MIIEVKVFGGAKRAREVIEEYLNELYKYNEAIKKYGIYLKPIHVVTRRTKGSVKRYYYFGRYWYKVIYSGKSGRISKVKWIYVGKEKPIREMPDPPPNPLELYKMEIENDNVCLYMNSIELLKKVLELFNGFNMCISVIQGL